MSLHVLLSFNYLVVKWLIDKQEQDQLTAPFLNWKKLEHVLLIIQIDFRYNLSS
jgi:hypothetical protein